MQKVVISPRFGGFGLSEKAVALGREISENPVWGQYEWELERDDPVLVAVLEKLGTEEASGDFARLQIAEIPEGVEWTVEEYDGNEWVAEKHQKWRGLVVPAGQDDLEKMVSGRKTVEEGE